MTTYTAYFDLNGCFTPAALLLVVALCGGAFAQPAENPVTRLFPRDLSFHLTFDDETVNPSLGRAPITRVSKRPQGGYVFSDGLFGRGLAAGWASFPIKGESPVVRIDRPGTAVFWVQLATDAPEPRVDRLGRKLEAGASFFAMIGKNVAYTVGKCPDDPNGSGTVWFHNHGTRANGEKVDRRCTPRFSFADWKKGEWRMVAVAWAADALCVSVNGAPFAKCPSTLPLGELTVDTLYVRGSSTGKPGWWVIDECSILTRKLSDEEVKKLYEETKKEAKR